jgi:hypothetical protein
MSAISWLPVGKADAKKLSEARHQVHNAAQWLVRAAHSYMQPQPEQAHTWLRWDAKNRALVSQEFLPKLALELEPADLTLQFRESGKPAPHIIELDDRTPAEVEAWVLVELLHRRLDRDRFSKALPYEMPNLMTGDAIPYLRETLETPLAEVSAWLANAASVLTRIAEEMFPGGSVWCWPDVFHMVLLPQARADASTSGHKLRAGLALGADAGEPYFYVTRDGPGTRTMARPHAVLTVATLLASGQSADCALEFLRREIDAQRQQPAR